MAGSTWILTTVTLWLDYCNALYIGLPSKSIWNLHLVQNVAAQLLLEASGAYILLPFCSRSTSCTSGTRLNISISDHIRSPYLSLLLCSAVTACEMARLKSAERCQLSWLSASYAKLNYSRLFYKHNRVALLQKASQNYLDKLLGTTVCWGLAPTAHYCSIYYAMLTLMFCFSCFFNFWLNLQPKSYFMVYCMSHFVDCIN